MERKNTHIAFSLLAALATLVFSGCSGSDPANNSSVPPGAKMDPFNPRMGTVTAKNLFRTLSVATGVDPAAPNAVNASVSTRFSNVQLGLPVDGGFGLTGVNQKSAADLAGEFCNRLVEQDAAMAISDPRRRTGGVNFEVGYGTLSGGNWSLFSKNFQRGWLRNLIPNLVAEPATDAEIDILMNALAQYIPLLVADTVSFVDNAQGTAESKRKKVGVILTCIPIAVAHHSFF